MIDKLKALKAHFSELESLLSDPAVISDMESIRNIRKNTANLRPSYKK